MEKAPPPSQTDKKQGSKGGLKKSGTKRSKKKSGRKKSGVKSKKMMVAEKQTTPAPSVVDVVSQSGGPPSFSVPEGMKAYAGSRGITERKTTNYRGVYISGVCMGVPRAGFRCGIGVWIGGYQDYNIVEPLDGEPQTANRAVIWAAIRALQMCRELGVPRPVTIYLDNAFVHSAVGGLLDTWKSKGWQTSRGTTVTHAQDFNELAREIDRFGRDDIKWVLIKSHGNNALDLAKQGVRSSRR